MSPCSHELFLYGQPALRASGRIARPASPPLVLTLMDINLKQPGFMLSSFEEKLNELYCVVEELIPCH